MTEVPVSETSTRAAEYRKRDRDEEDADSEAEGGGPQRVEGGFLSSKVRCVTSETQQQWEGRLASAQQKLKKQEEESNAKLKKQTEENNAKLKRVQGSFQEQLKMLSHSRDLAIKQMSTHEVHKHNSELLMDVVSKSNSINELENTINALTEETSRLKAEIARLEEDDEESDRREVALELDQENQSNALIETIRVLKQEYDNSLRALGGLARKICKKNRAIQALACTIGHVDKHNTEIEAELSGLKLHQETELASLSNHVTNLESEVHQRQAELTAKTEELEIQTRNASQVSTLQAELDALQSKLEEKQTELTLNIADLDSKKREIKSNLVYPPLIDTYHKLTPSQSTIDELKGLIELQAQDVSRATALQIRVNTLQPKLEKSEADLKAKEQEVATKLSTIDELEGKLKGQAQGISRVTGLQTQVNTLQSELDKNKAELAAKITDLATKDQEAAASLSTIKDLEKKLEAQPQNDSRIAKLRNDVSDLRCKLATNETTLATRTKDLATKDQEVAKKLSTIAELERKLKAQAQDVSRIKTLQTQVATLQSKLNRTEVELTAKTTDLMTREEEVTANLLTITQLQNGAKEASSVVPELEKALREKETEISELVAFREANEMIKGQLQRAQQESSKLSKENEALKRVVSLADDPGSAKLVEGDYDKLFSDLRTARADKGIMQRERDESRHQHEILRSRKEEMDITITELQTELKKLRETQASKDQELLDAQEKTRRLQEAIQTDDTKDREIHNLRELLQKARYSLAQLTAPLPSGSPPSGPPSGLPTPGQSSTPSGPPPSGPRAGPSTTPGPPTPGRSSTPSGPPPSGPRTGPSTTPGPPAPGRSSTPPGPPPARPPPGLAPTSDDKLAEIYIKSKTKARNTLAASLQTAKQAASNGRDTYILKGPQITAAPAVVANYPWLKTPQAKEKKKDKGKEKEKESTSERESDLEESLSSDNDSEEREKEKRKKKKKKKGKGKGKAKEGEDKKRKKKKKTRGLNVGVDMGVNGDDVPEEPESDHSLVLKSYMDKKSKASTGEQTKNEALKEVNRLLRKIQKEALPAQRAWQIFGRPSVSDERLALFNQDPRNNSPQVHNTRLDKRGHTTTEALKASKWNRELVRKLVHLAKHIIDNCPDKDIFGEFEWSLEELTGNMDKRFGRVWNDIIAIRPRNPQEVANPMLIVERRSDDHAIKKFKSALRSLRQTKYDSRMKIIGTMVQRSRGSEQAVQFWKYTSTIIDGLGPDGMSDEEPDLVEAREGEDFVDNIPVFNILNLHFRHPSLRALCVYIDATPQREHLEVKTYSKSVRRRVPTISPRKPGKNHFRAFLDPEWLDTLLPHEIDDLKLQEGHFILYDFTQL
ncbi:hypothetical protein AAF712_007988 [Marasmius tenuissimus]|uniref:Uncharacterized protein n=1 Tax=Marasmius tenuissimus TaxID=585030 RepID=A0ABR2ZTI8_9AGAR